MALKISIFFEQSGQGWSEVYWNNDNDPIAFCADQQKATAASDSFVVNRAKMLSPNAEIRHIRASIDGAFRQEWGVDYGPGSMPGQSTRTLLGIVPVGAEPVLPPAVRIEVQTASVSANNPILKRKNYLGGVPADLMNPQGGLVQSPNWIAVATAFFTTGKHRPLVVRSLPFAAAGTPIKMFTVTADGLGAIITPSPLLAVKDQKGLVNVRGIKTPHGWNGIHRGVNVASVLNVGTFDVQIGPRRKVGVTVPPWNFGDGGTIQGCTPSYSPITTVAALALVKKSTGRPFGVPRGRRNQP